MAYPAGAMARSVIARGQAFLDSARARRGRRALERQLVYQEAKARALPECGAEMEAIAAWHARVVLGRLETFGPVPHDARVLEVGSGSTGLVFFLGMKGAVGVDPLANAYSRLFPKWQSRVRTVEAFGEALPFPDASFDIVLSQNAVNHSPSPAAIVSEMVRVLAPGGRLYFAVHVHHPFYACISTLYGAWSALGVPIDVPPFSDTPVHLTVDGARRLFKGHPLRVLYETTGIEAAKNLGRSHPPGNLRHVLKRLFFLNALYELIARKAE